MHQGHQSFDLFLLAHAPQGSSVLEESFGKRREVVVKSASRRNVERDIDVFSNSIHIICTPTSVAIEIRMVCCSCFDGNYCWW